MSKKIIYLLSLLMVLSLVFASCKKNNPLSAAGGIQKPDTITPPSDGLTGGLFTDKEKLDEYATKVVQASEIDKYANKNYKRNPVITVLDGQSVMIVYEIRYQSAGSGNDVALTGTNSVDIAYKLSTDGGVSFENGGQPTIINEANSISESHGAPIVYNTGKHVIIVASAGIGLSVGTYDNSKAGTDQSWLEYTYAEIIADDTGSGKGPILGAWAKWTKINGITMDGINTDMGKKNDAPFKQYGTHTSRGVVVGSTGSQKILLPVTVAEFIQNSNGWGDSRWGYIVYSLTVNNGQLTTPTKQGTGAEMDIRNHKTKTTRVAAATSESKFTTLTVSDNSSNLVLYKGEDGGTVSPTTIKGGDGSPGILVVDKWVGGTYDPTQYSSQPDNKKTLLSHVLELEKNVAIREVRSDFSEDVAGTYFELGGAYATASKSSSIDILKDGTIVMAVEGGKVETGVSGRPFYIYFNRYTQAYLASQMGN